MTKQLIGPLEDVYALTSGIRVSGRSSALAGPLDRDLLAKLLRRYLESPIQREQIRLLLGPSYEGSTDGPAFVAEVALRISRGEIVMRYVDAPSDGGYLPGTRTTATGATDTTPSEPPPEETRLRDWKLECHHHTSLGARPIFERGTKISVVPDKGTIEDIVHIHYRDDFDPPPPALRCSGKDVPKSGSSGGYDVYDFAAKFGGDIDKDNFLTPSFWTEYLRKTTYSVTGAPSAIAVTVYNPRQYKFEFKFPPLGRVKAGAKLEKDIERSGRSFSTPGVTKESWAAEAEGWSPSTLSFDKISGGSPGQTIAPTKKALIAFSVDDDAQEVEVIQYIGTLLNFYTACMGIVDAIKENAPKVGWYIDFELQLMQGGVAIQWYWKEHTDTRVFQFIDFNIELKIFCITFELGIGISGLGFKAQVFAQLSGELSISANAQRNDPDGLPGFAIPVKGTIKGALGARFEAGNLFKAEGKGETGLEVVVELGINRGRSTIVHLDGSTSWTGIKIEATVSGGLFGLGRSKKWERTLVQPTRLGGFDWPKPEPFKPPYLSRGRIKTVLQNVITSGFNVRVIRVVEGLGNDVHWTPAQIATALADQIDAHESFHRTSKMVDGVAHAIRKDLDRLGSRWGRDWIEETAFLSYARGPELRAHLDAMVNPAAALAAS